MLKRREFIKTSVVVATAASSGVLSGQARTQESMDHRGHIDFVIVDDEIEDSVLFARELVTHGSRPFSVQDDIGRLWFGELGAAFQAGKSIAGLTTHSELFVCSTFARQTGARLRYEGSHDCRGSNILTHSVSLDASNRGFSTRLARADTDWPRMLAAHVADIGVRSNSSCTECCTTTTRRSSSHPGSLFSWLIA